MTDAEKARQAPGFRLERIDRKAFMTQAARMSDVILTASLGTIHPGVEKIKGQRRMHPDARMQCRCRPPGSIAHRSDELSHSPGRAQGHRAAVASDEIARRREAGHFDLQAFHRGI